MVALLTLPGIPQIYYGNEVGMYGGQDPFNRRMMPEWAFDGRGRRDQEDRFDGFVQAPDEVHDHVRRLLSIRQARPSLQNGSYTELWRQNGPSNNNVWAYLRTRGEEATVVAFNNGYLATDGSVPLGVGSRFPDGTVFRDLLGEGDVGPFTVRDGHLPIALPGRGAVILVPDASDAEFVEFEFSVAADTQYGQRVFVTGDAAHLGAWDLNQARVMTPRGCEGTRCTWSGSVRVKAGQPLSFKFVIIDEALNVVWEWGANRTLTPSETNARFSGTFR